MLGAGVRVYTFAVATPMNYDINSRMVVLKMEYEDHNWCRRRASVCDCYQTRPRHMQDSVFGTDFFQVIEFEAGWNEIFTEENNVSAEILEFFLELSRDGIEIDLCTMDDPIAYINNIERFEEVGITEEGDDVTHRFERDYHVHIDKKRAMAKVHWLLSDYSKSIENVRFSSNPRLSRQVLELCFGIIMHATDLRFVGYRCKQLKDEGGSTRCTVRSKFALLMTASTGKQYQLSLTENVICQYEAQLKISPDSRSIKSQYNRQWCHPL